MPRFAVASETGRLREVLVCPPDHYRWIPTNAVARRTLAEGAAPDAAAFAAQHRELVAALEQGGARVHALPAAPHLPYMAYTRDQAVTTPWGPVLCQLERPQRRGEYAAVLDWHAAQVADGGSAFWRKSSAGTLEGGDIHLIRPGLAVIGVSGGRTDEAGAAQLAAWLEAEGWECRLQPFDEHFLHLDLLFCMAAPGLALACPEALDDGFLAWLRGHGIRWIPFGYREAMALSGNILALGDGRVISSRGSTRINAALRAEGLAVLDPDLSLFAAGGGGPHCLTCPLLREDP
ncbi:dimethylarginine dimethylaminohydrolase family protein [Roseomonas sp. AR75]|uniref:dimethylarginine dimethylaminohydrolase family protein n=1 Tax=Roseomonas sp. AR75 TaxID=2562311 RepID=UPI0010C08BFD|nr:arginine deiminase family protein [Roseomonas sp. AR75]